MAKIAVVGAGMGGLAFASAMRNSQHEVKVYEQASELAELGAGISLWANGTRLFEEMGIAERMASDACETDVAFFRDEDGAVAASQPLARDNWYRNAYGYPYYGALRTTLQSAMLDVIGVDNIQLGKQLVRIDDTGAQAEMHWADGSSDTADLIIGADGIKSIVRNAVDASARPIFTGNCAFRGRALTTDLHLLPEPHSFTDWMGDGKHVLNFPVGGDFKYTTIVVFLDGPETWEHEEWRIPADPAAIRKLFDGWHPAVSEMLEHVNLSERWGLFQVSPMQSWYKGRTVLIGDAAHGMLPHHGQGAISSFEDAITLAHILNDEKLVGMPEKLAVYEQERKSRGELIQRSSRELNACLHLPEGPARIKRAEVLSKLPEHFGWLHNHVCRP